MHIGLDVSNALTPRPTGVARYIQRLVRHLPELPGGPRLTLYCRPSRRRHGSPGALFPGHEIRWLTRLTSFRGLDLFHAPDLRAPRSRVPLVVTLHDLSSVDRNDHASARFLRRKRDQVAFARSRAAVVITHTETVASAIRERLGLPAARVFAVPLADPLDGSSVSSSLPREPFLLTVGGPSSRKGSSRLGPLLELWSRDLDWHPTVEWVGSTSDDKARAIIGQLPHPERIRWRGHVTDEELARLYQRASGLLMLSDTEGFAMPLLEAAARDCPVMAVESAALREVLGDGAFWFEDPPSQGLEIFRAFRDPQICRARVAIARDRAAAYSWERTARLTFEAYGAAVALGDGPPPPAPDP